MNEWPPDALLRCQSCHVLRHPDQLTLVRARCGTIAVCREPSRYCAEGFRALGVLAEKEGPK